MRFCMRLLSSGSDTSVQSASFTLLPLDLLEDGAGLLPLELIEIVVALFTGISASALSLASFSFPFKDSLFWLCLISFTMWCGIAEGGFTACLRRSRRFMFPCLYSDELKNDLSRRGGSGVVRGIRLKKAFGTVLIAPPCVQMLGAGCSRG